jgi:hypothetical protein
VCNSEGFELAGFRQGRRCRRRRRRRHHHYHHHHHHHHHHFYVVNNEILNKCLRVNLFML